MAPTEEKKAGEATEEDSPLVKQLKELDDKVLASVKEYEDKRQELQRKWTELQKPVLEKRSKILTAGGSEDNKTGTPALKGFWLKALQNNPDVSEHIEAHDAPVLEYIKDIVAIDLDPKDSNKGFRLKFIFAENPYFTNSVLSKEIHCSESNPYADEMDVDLIIGCTIDWKKGMDVTVAKAKAKEKKAAKGKKKSEKDKEEPRASFFRSFFRTFKKDGRLPDSMLPEDIESVAQFMEGADEEDIVGVLMEHEHGAASSVRDFIIPYAVRWFTGEAKPEGDDDDDEDGEEESDDEGDDEEEDSESDDEPKAKGKKGAPAKKSPKDKAKKSPKLGAGGDPKEKEECKQQ
jgi:nucleosome assembly protein 1-like 1